MPSSATPVQLIDPDTNRPYRTGAGESTSVNQTNGSQKTQVVGPTGTVGTVRPLGQQLDNTDAGQVVTATVQYFNTQTSAFTGLVGDSQGLSVVNRGGGSIATGQVSVTTSSTLVVAARTARQKVTITPTSSTVFYVGNAGVTTTTGLYVAAGAAITLDTSAAIYAVGASALTVSFVEYF